MIVLFSLFIFTAKDSFDSGISRLISHAGLVKSTSTYEEDFYPALKAIDYQGFIHE